MICFHFPSFVSPYLHHQIMYDIVKWYFVVNNWINWHQHKIYMKCLVLTDELYVDYNWFNIEGSCRSWKKIVKVWMMEARAKCQSVFVSVVSVDCVSPVKGAVAYGKKAWIFNCNQRTWPRYLENFVSNFAFRGYQLQNSIPAKPIVQIFLYWHQNGNYGMNFRPNPKWDRTQINFLKFLHGRTGRGIHICPWRRTGNGVGLILHWQKPLFPYKIERKMRFYLQIY